MPYKDPVARREYARKYYSVYNKTEKMRAYQAAWKRRQRATDGGESYRAMQVWRRANPDKIREYRERAERRRHHGDAEATLKRRNSQDARKARKLGAAGECTAAQWMARIEYYGWCCAYCGKELQLRGMHRDHVKPLVAGGSEWPSNLVPACGTCNCRKGPRRWAPRPVWLKR